MHCGRISHRFNRQIDEAPVAPSALRAAGEMWTDVMGLQKFSTPRALATEEIPALVDEHRQATVNALAAGFDGIELHSANGYLSNQFLSTATNKRTDKYGGSIQNRIRFVLECLEGMIDGAGSSTKVGIRISPGTVFNDVGFEDDLETHIALVKALNPLNLAYLHIQRTLKIDALTDIRPLFKGPLIVAGILTFFFCGDHGVVC